MHSMHREVILARSKAALSNQNRQLNYTQLVPQIRPPNEAGKEKLGVWREEHLEEIGHGNTIETTRSLSSERYPTLDGDLSIE